MDWYDIKFLESVMDKSGKRESNVQAETEADIAFHMGIACASHNSVYVDLIIYDLLIFF